MTHNSDSPRKPAVTDYQVHTRLKDGTPVWIALCPADDKHCDAGCLKEQLRRAYPRLSGKSRRLRFVSPPARLEGWRLDYLSRSDKVDHVVLCAHRDSESRFEGMGLARFVRLRSDPGVAEFSMTVLDLYQNRGLGRLLLELLVDVARKNGISKLQGYVLLENKSMLSVLSHFDTRVYREDSLYCVELNPARENKTS